MREKGKTEETDSQKSGLQSKSTSRGKNRKILEFSQLQTPRRGEKVGRCMSEVGRRKKNSRSTENAKEAKIKELGNAIERANMGNGFETQTGQGGKRNSRII